MKDLIPIQTVLLSVTDKTGLIAFVDGLKQINPNIRLIASGGTFAALKEAGFSPVELSSYTQFPECFNGRVKTLHPKIAGGILFRRDQDEEEAEKLGIYPIDLVVCNLYDFAGAASDPNLEVDQLVEKLDIGGSTLIRASCKNHASVGIVVNPADYAEVLEDIRAHHGVLTLKTREKLCVKALQKSAEYEILLAKEFTRKLSEESIDYLPLVHGKQLRYGENPDQQACSYAFKAEKGVIQAKILAGKEVSYNNFEDATVAYNASQNFSEVSASPNVVIVKHGSFCGAGVAPQVVKAFELAWDGDPKSAFGSVIAISGTVTEALVPSIAKKFIEVIIAPEFSDSFISWAKSNKPNLRLLQVDFTNKTPKLYKTISGGVLVQTAKQRLLPENWKELLHGACSHEQKVLGLVTEKGIDPLTEELFAFGVAASHYAKSNTIALVREKDEGQFQILGLGVGQPNRVDTLQRLAYPKAIENLEKEGCKDIKNEMGKCVLASDGFFFEDTLQFGVEKGIHYYIQPGGSVKDSEVIKAANTLGVCLILTGIRYFYH